MPRWKKMMKTMKTMTSEEKTPRHMAYGISWQLGAFSTTSSGQVLLPIELANDDGGMVSFLSCGVTNHVN